MPDQTHTALSTLHDEYIEAVNVVIGENREDLVAELVAAYPDAALRVLTGDEHQRAA